jgi:uncharacterized membrane protein
MQMPGTKQIERTTSIDAPIEVVYELFMDNEALPDWAPVVDEVLAEDGGDPSGVGCTRTCAVTMDGRSGTMVERCVEAVADTRASFVVVDDSFGFDRMLRDYGFTVHFARRGRNRTSVRIETFYTPANPVAALLNRLILRRRFRVVVDTLLAGLRTTAEHRHGLSTGVNRDRRPPAPARRGGGPTPGSAGAPPRSA